MPIFMVLEIRDSTLVFYVVHPIPIHMDITFEATIIALDYF